MRKRFFLAVMLVMVSLMAGTVPMCVDAACVNPPSGMVSWWGGDNNALDIVGNNNSTIYGGIIYGQGEVGRAFDLNGANGSYLRIPTSADLNIQGSLSISAWVYIRNTSGTRLIAGKAGGTQLYSADGILHFVVYSGNTPYHVISLAPLAGNSWHHVAGVFDGSAGVSRLYIDGALNNTTSSIPGPPDSNTAPYEIGGFSAYGANFDGLIDEVAIFNRALTGTDVQNIYAAGSAGMCRPSVAPPSGLVSWWRGENDATDSNGSNNGTLMNDATFAQGKVGQAFSLNGTNQYVDVPNSTLWNFGSNDFSINFWVNFDGATAFFLGHDNGGYGNNKWIFYLSGGKLSFHINGPYSVEIGQFPYTFAPGQWYHLAVTRSGSTYTIYVNGASLGTATDSRAIPDATAPLTIGQSEGLYFVHGLMDEIGIFNRALTADEIASIYNAGSSGMSFTPDTTPDTISFIPQTGMPTNTAIVSNPITVTGINTYADVSIVDGFCSVSTDGGSTWSVWSTDGTVSPNNQVKVRLMSSLSYSATTTAIVTIGGVSGTFSVTTAAATDPNVTGLVSWWRGDGNAYDSVGGNHGTPMNGISFGAGKTGQAFSFDGVDDFVRVLNPQNIPVGNSSRTISAWVKSSGGTNLYQGVVGYGSSPNPGQVLFFEWGGNAADLNHLYTMNLAWGARGATLLAYDTWYHVALIHDGSYTKLYVNGQLDASEAMTQNTVMDSAGLRIGKSPDFDGWHAQFKGLIDEVKIFNRALSASEVIKLTDMVPDTFSFTAQTGMPLSVSIISNPVTVTGIDFLSDISITGGDYQVNGGSWTSLPGTVNNGDTVMVRQTSSASNSTLTTATLTIGGVSGAFNVTTAALGDPDASGLISWWKGNNNTLDSVGGNHGTLQGGAGYAGGASWQAFSFDGVDDYFRVSGPQNIPVGNSQRAIGAWIMSSGPTAGTKYQTVLGYGTPGTDGQTFLLEWGGDVNDRKLYLTGWNRDIAGTTSLNYNQWYHVTATYDGTTVRLYINGVLDASADRSLNTIINASGLLIGNSPPNDGWHANFNGFIYGVKLFNRALSGTEVSKLAGTLPDPFTFPPVFGASRSATVESEAITVTGISNPSTISISDGDEYRINGAWKSSPGTFNPDDPVKVRLTSSGSYSTMKTATLTIGGVNGTFTVTTLADTEKPVVTTFTLQTAVSSAMSVSVDALIATDNSGIVSGYMVTDTATPPAADDPGWSATVPATVTLSTAGDNTLRAWAKDPAGNVSEPLPATVLLKPVRREPETDYVSLQTAYGEAGSGETIKVLAVTLAESIDLNQPRNISISGGYGDGFAGQSGYSTIQGTLTVGAGSIKVERVILK